MLGIQLANGVIQPLTNFLLNDLTRVHQKKTAFQAAGKGAVTVHVDQSHQVTRVVMYTEHEEATEKFSRVSKVRETDRVSLCVVSDLHKLLDKFTSLHIMHTYVHNAHNYIYNVYVYI